MKRCVLFDFDGVIINSEPVIKAAFTLSFRDIVGTGEPPVREYLKHMGDSFDGIMRKMGLPSQMYASFSDYSTKLSNLVEVFPLMPQILHELKDQEILIGLVTGKDRKRVLHLLDTLQLPSFDVIVAGDDVEHPKPHPQPLEMAMTALKAHPSQTWMVGDSPNDIIAAQRAGVSSCAVGWGIGTRQELESVRPDQFVESASQLRDLLLGVIA